MYDLVQYLYAEQFAELHVHEFVHMDSEEIYSTVPPGLSINMESSLYVTRTRTTSEIRLSEITGGNRASEIDRKSVV